MITVQVEPGILNAGRIMPMFVAHAKEVLGEEKAKDFNLNWTALTAMNNANLLRGFSLKKGSEIVGYSLWQTSYDYMYAHIHRADEICLFVDPKYRGRWAIRLMRFCEESLISEGVKRLVRYAPTKLCEKLGYKPLQTLMVRDI